MVLVAFCVTVWYPSISEVSVLVFRFLLPNGVCLFVCACVCQHDNFRTSKHRMMKLRGRCIVQKSRLSSNLGVITPWVRIPQNVAFAYDVGKISTGCLVDTYVEDWPLGVTSGRCYTR